MSDTISVITRETPDGYTFNDIQDGIQIDTILCSPETPPQRIELLYPDGAKMLSTGYNRDVHSADMTALFGDTVIMLPPSGVRIHYFTPMTRINLFVSSDVYKPVSERETGFLVYAENGDVIGGYAGGTAFGPVADLPEGQKDWQYMVWMMPPPLPPPYSNPLLGRPCTYLDLFPGGPDVYMGCVKAD